MGEWSALALDFGLSFSRGCNAPELIECVHVERQVEDPAVVESDWRVDVVVHLYESGDILPEALTVGVEDVGAVEMHVDGVDFAASDIAAHGVAAVDH